MGLTVNYELNDAIDPFMCFNRKQSKDRYTKSSDKKQSMVKLIIIIIIVDSIGMSVVNFTINEVHYFLAYMGHNIVAVSNNEMMKTNCSGFGYKIVRRGNKLVTFGQKTVCEVFVVIGACTSAHEFL